MPKRALLVLAIVSCCSSLFADQQDYPFAIAVERESAGHRIVARNGGPAPVSVSVAIAGSRNISADRPLPLVAVLPAGGGSVELARIRPATPGAPYNFSTRSSWVLGDLNARQSADALYRLPYRDGQAFHIGQAPGGPVSTHTSAESQYAVDIGMPEGTPVVAARDGVVIFTEARQVYGGRSPDLIGKANEVRIQHVDGTIAVYAHLAHRGVFVRPGQIVTAGTPIGLAGTTGYSSGPHLHFVVQTVARTGNGLAMVSLPFRFYVGKPPAIFSPRYGMYAVAQYSAPAPPPVAVAPRQPGRQSVSGQAPAGAAGFR